MRRHAIAVIAVALVVALPGFAHGVSGTCTISRFTNINLNLGLDFGVPVANGLAMPVEIDEAAGTFSMLRDAWSSRFGAQFCNATESQTCAVDGDCPVGEACATGAAFLTVGAVHGFIAMSPGAVMGTIDAGGNVVLPRFAETFLTDYTKPIPVLMNAPTVSTGIRQTSVGGDAFPSEGVPLDFSTGDLTLSGTDLLRGAPGANGDIAAGFSMTCRLAPIPSPAKLPRAPVLDQATGKAQVAVAPTTQARPASGRAGDVLFLKAKLAAGAGGLTVDGTQDFFVRVSAGSNELALLFVPANRFRAKGKKLVASRDDSCDTAAKVCKSNASRACTTPADCTSGPRSILVFAPDPRERNLKKQSGSPMLGGSIIVKRVKSGAIVTLKVPGLTLAEFSGTGTIAVAIGATEAGKQIAINGTGTRRTFR